MIRTIWGGICLFLGICWLLGGAYVLTNGILTAVYYNELASAAGIFTAGILIFILGIFTIVYGTKQVKKEKQPLNKNNNTVHQ